MNKDQTLRAAHSFHTAYGHPVGCRFREKGFGEDL